MKTLPAVTVSYEVTMTLSEEEARALDAVLGYSEDDFLKVFYEHLGTAYLKRHEDGFRRLSDNVRTIIRPQLAHIDEIRRVAKV